MTVHSDWGDWLPTAIHDANPSSVTGWYLGCNGFVLKAPDGTTIFIDPYLGTGDPPRTVRMVPVPFDPTDVMQADAILVTHEHSDHVHGPSQAPLLATTGGTLFGPDDSIAVTQSESWTDTWDVTDDQFVEITEGTTFDVGSFTISVEPAYDPDATHPVSYLIDHPNGTFYHGGDTKSHDLLADIGMEYDITVGVIAFGSSGMILDKHTREPKFTEWYCDENEAIDAAAKLRLKRLMPSHWDMWKGLTVDPTTLYDHARSFDYPQAIDIVEIGDQFTLSD